MEKTACSLSVLIVEAWNFLEFSPYHASILYMYFDFMIYIMASFLAIKIPYNLLGNTESVAKCIEIYFQYDIQVKVAIELP